MKTTILLIFIPIIILSVSAVGFVCYRLAADQIEKNAYRNLSDTVSQTRNYLDYRLTAVFEQLVALQNNIDTFTFLRRINSDSSDILSPEDYININPILERIFTANYSIIDSILIYFNDGRVLLTKKDYISPGISFSFSEWRQRFHDSPSDYYWQGLHPNQTFRVLDKQSRVISVFKMFGNENSKIKGIILFNLKEDFFKQVFHNAQISENGYLALISPEQIMKFKSIAPRYLLNRPADIVNRLELKGGVLERDLNGEKMVVVYNTLEINRWKLAAVLPESDILNKISFIKYITFIIISVLILVALLLSNLLAKIITKPLSLLTEKVKQVEEGNLDTPFDINSQNEIGILNHGISTLIIRVKNLLIQVKREQEMNRQAEFAVLQAQIRPHFLYNTLDSIKQLCEMGENKTASAMVSSLAKYFRISISRGRETIKIAEEVEHIHNYLVIQQMRYADDFDYEIQIEPEIRDFQIVKLTLQPLVENAIYHGIKQVRGKGIITVRGYRANSDIIIEVQDSGPGMPPDKLEILRHSLQAPVGKNSSGFGMCNVHQRLQFHYGTDYGLELPIAVSSGMIVRVKIPAIKEAGESNDL